MCTMTNVLILAGGNVKSKLNFLKSNCECPALIPINTRPAISYICEFYSGFPDLKLYLSVNESQLSIIKSEIMSLDMDLNLIAMPETGNVNESLKYSIEKIPGSESVIVNLVTTIPTCKPELNEVLVDNCKSISVGWSGINADNNKTVFLSKNTELTGMESYAFTGIFHVNKAAFDDAIDINSNDMLDVVAKISSKENLEYRKTDWIDCGHELNYYDAKSKLINSRNFNTITINENSMVTKRSSDIKKLKEEYLFIKMLPPQISHYFPRVIKEFNLIDNQAGSYTLEFYGYPSMSELCLYWNLEDNHWGRIFSHLSEHLKLFRKHRYSIGINAHKEFYINKLFNRINAYFEQLDNENNPSWKDREITVNNYPCMPIEKLKNKIIDKFNSIYDETHFCIMHGDYCFNNILYDIPSGIVKYIDPRGSFGDACIGIYGDQKYDLAKLAHSTIGHYDYIVNNLYELKESNDGFNFDFKLRNNHRILEDLTENIIQELGYKYEEIIFIMGTLFLSMTPLHSDSKTKQKILYLHGLKIMNEIL